MRFVIVAAVMLLASAEAVPAPADTCEPLEPCTAKERALFERFRANAARSVYEDRWQVIQLQDEVLVALDRKSVVTLGENTFRVWVRAEKDEWVETWRNAKGSHSKPANALLIQQDFDCSRRRARGVSMIMYFNRTVVWGPVDLEGHWHGISPDSSEEYWYPQICKTLTGTLPP